MLHRRSCAEPLLCKASCQPSQKDEYSDGQHTAPQRRGQPVLRGLRLRHPERNAQGVPFVILSGARSAESKDPARAAGLMR